MQNLPREHCQRLKESLRNGMYRKAYTVFAQCVLRGKAENTISHYLGERRKYDGVTGRMRGP